MKDEPSLSEEWRAPIEKFFSQLDKNDSDSFFLALDVLRPLDTKAMARAHISAVARKYFNTTSRGEREKIVTAIPHFGYAAIAFRHDVAISFSVRNRGRQFHPTLSTSDRSEYHRVESGELTVIECVQAGTGEAANSYHPARTKILRTGDEISRRAGESALALVPTSPVCIFSVGGWSSTSFKENVDAATGRVIGRSFSSSEDSILVNVLELCALWPEHSLAEDVVRHLTHSNHRVRLASMKACLANKAIAVSELAHIANRDANPLISSIGKKMLEKIA